MVGAKSWSAHFYEIVLNIGIFGVEHFATVSPSMTAAAVGHVSRLP